MLTHRVRRLRFATRAVTVIQCAAVTFVPVLHPYFHDRPAVGAPTAGPSLPGSQNAAHGRHLGDACLICSAHPGFPQPAAAGLEQWPSLTTTLPLGPSSAELRSASPWLANRVRAPPQL